MTDCKECKKRNARSNFILVLLRFYKRKKYIKFTTFCEKHKYSLDILEHVTIKPNAP